MDLAVVHGNYLEEGGAEHVSRELADIYNAPIYYGFGKDEDDLNGADAPDHYSVYNDSPLSPILKRSIMLRDLYYMWNAQYIEDLHDHDVLLFSKNELAWYVPKDEQVVIHYLHTTPRTLYDLFYEKGGSPVSRMYASAARPLFLPATKYPDLFICNSELVKRRAKKFWGVEEDRLEVVYPPVPVDEFSSQPTKDYYLTYSRLVEDKRIDNIVRAFEDLDEKLIVGGTGEQEEYLKKIAPENVEFVGYMSEEEKKRRLGEAKAVLFNARNEDFGLIPCEAFASETPVIGVEDGYTKYQVRDGKNGVTHAPDPDSIADAVRRFDSEGVDWDGDRIGEFAERYSRDRFREEIQDLVSETVADAQIDPYSEN